MKIKAFTLLVLALTTAFIFSSCYKKRVKGDQNIVEKEIPITDYNKIQLSISGNLTYEQKTDSEPYLLIKTDENIFSLLSITTSDSTLVIESEKNIKPSEFSIVTNSKRLMEIALEGSTKIDLKGKLISDSMRLKIAGSGTIKTDSLICKFLDIKIGGSGDIRLKGVASNAKFAIAGSGDIRAYELQADTVTCKIAGSGDIQVTAHRLLDINIAGSGDVKYKGEPKVSQSIAGSGKIKQVDSGENNVIIGISEEKNKK